MHKTINVSLLYFLVTSLFYANNGYGTQTDLSNSSFFTWIKRNEGQLTPKNAIFGGQDFISNEPFFICRARLNGNLYLGRLFSNRCYIAAEQQELTLSTYEVLVGQQTLHWESSSFGSIPTFALAGGFEYGEPSYICQVDYPDGKYPGKLSRKYCHTTREGKEILSSQYNILVR